MSFVFLADVLTEKDITASNMRPLYLQTAGFFGTLALVSQWVNGVALTSALVIGIGTALAVLTCVFFGDLMIQRLEDRLDIVAETTTPSHPTAATQPVPRARALAA